DARDLRANKALVEVLGRLPSLQSLRLIPALPFTPKVALALERGGKSSDSLECRDSEGHRARGGKEGTSSSVVKDQETSRGTSVEVHLSTTRMRLSASGALLAGLHRHQTRRRLVDVLSSTVGLPKPPPQPLFDACRLNHLRIAMHIPVAPSNRL